jgi:hypothetical protein
MSWSRKAPKLTEDLVELVERRLELHAKARWPHCREIRVRRRGRFVYVDARSAVADDVEPLIRLSYTGDSEQWGLAFFTWSREAYEPCILSNGEWAGSPEDCFDTAAMTMLA